MENIVKSKKSLVKPGKKMSKLVLSGKRPCNGHKDECTASQN